MKKNKMAFVSKSIGSHSGPSMNPFFVLFKNLFLQIDCRFNQAKFHVDFMDHRLAFVKTHFWNEEGQQKFNEEVLPYFKCLEGRTFPNPVVIDAGGYVGQFTLAWKSIHPNAFVHIFEPSERNRVLIQRNLKLNHLNSSVKIHPFGLWNKEDVLAFRTHGAMSALSETGHLPMNLDFSERVPTLCLDDWMERENPGQVHIVKMDIEGSEIEAIQGASKFLLQHRPLLLIQAYHLRNGVRTFETCLTLLEKIGYQCSEPVPGTLLGWFPNQA
jgi:FkbM family methyltransferase